MRIFFATDIHGSETCWRKLLKAGDYYEADVVVLGGDMTGKALVPIIKLSADAYECSLQGQVHEFSGNEALAKYTRMIRDRGLYSFITDRDELEALKADPGRLEAQFVDAVLRAMEEWIARADQAYPRHGTPLFVCPGNDDAFEIDGLLAQARSIEVTERRCIPLGGGYEMVSTGWSNPTPWNTHREATEDELDRMIAEMTGAASVPADRLVFNFHCPPFGVSPIDEAPAVTEDMQVMHGGREMRHVGSTAVYRAIERIQPALSLHGHIHEGRGAVRLGKSMVMNPGSSYESGVLQGALIELNGKRVKSHWLTSG